MKAKLLSVDNDTKRFEEQYPIWLKHGIELIRAYSMQEAIERLTHEDYVMIGINADSVNYLPQLKIMRDVTKLPIHILTSDYTYEKECEAINLGADQFKDWWPDTDESTRRGILMIQRYSDRHQKLPLNFTIYNNIMIYPDYRKVFVNDIEIELTKKEFDILYLLMRNHHRVFTYQQIYNAVWGDDYIDDGNNSLFSEIKRLRKKLKINEDNPDYIKNVHNLGYSFD